jgi:hypothetical protein
MKHGFSPLLRVLSNYSRGTQFSSIQERNDRGALAQVNVAVSLANLKLRRKSC